MSNNNLQNRRIISRNSPTRVLDCSSSDAHAIQRVLLLQVGLVIVHARHDVALELDKKLVQASDEPNDRNGTNMPSQVRLEGEEEKVTDKVYPAV